MNCQQVRPLLEEYALDLVADPVEKGNIRAHIERCDSCRQLAHAYSDVLDALPWTLAQISPQNPPPRLKSAVLAAVQSSEVRAHSMEVASASRSLTLTKHMWNRARQFILNPRAWIVSLSATTAVSAILLAVALSANLQLQHTIARERNTLSESNARQLEHQVAFQVLNSTNLQEITLRPVSSLSAAYGKLFVDHDQGTMVFIATNLPPLEDGQIFALWLDSTYSNRPVATFVPDANGFAVLTISHVRIRPSDVVLTRISPNVFFASSEPILTWRASRGTESDTETALTVHRSDPAKFGD